jgi:hypothetical protein
MIFVGGEVNSAYPNGEAWASLDGGYTWNQCSSSTGWGYRWQTAATISPSGYLVLVGGASSGNVAVNNDIWQSIIPLNVSTLVQYCGFTAPPCNLGGLKCWPTAPDTVITSTGATCPATTSCTAPSTGVTTNWFPFIRITLTAPWWVRAMLALQYVNGPVSFTDVTGTARSFSGQILLVTGQRIDAYTANVPFNDVWASSDNTNWYLISGNMYNLAQAYGAAATTSYTSSSGGCVAYNNRTNTLVRIGGYTYINSAYAETSTVFKSVDNGVTWTQLSSPSNVEGRQNAGCVFDSSGRLILVGGALASGDIGDTFLSPDGGTTWIQQSSSETFGLRSAFGLVISKNPTINTVNDTLIMTSGYSGSAQYNDVWASSDLAATWSKISNAPWPIRDTSILLQTTDGALVQVGGDTTTAGDVWASLNGGYQWGLCSPAAGWMYRWMSAATIDANNYIILAGGANNPGNGVNGYANDVFRSTLPFTVANIQTHCNLTAPSCGVGLKCWPGAGTIVVGNTVSCAACPATSSSCKSSSTGSATATSVSSSSTGGPSRVPCSYTGAIPSGSQSMSLLLNADYSIVTATNNFVPLFISAIAQSIQAGLGLATAPLSSVGCTLLIGSNGRSGNSLDDVSNGQTQVNFILLNGAFAVPTAIAYLQSANGMTRLNSTFIGNSLPTLVPGSVQTVNNNNDNGSSSNSLSAGAIAGIVIGGVIALILLLCIICWLLGCGMLTRKKASTEEEHPQPSHKYENQVEESQQEGVEMGEVSAPTTENVHEDDGEVNTNI